jgi:hypothetical protein
LTPFFIFGCCPKAGKAGSKGVLSELLYIIKDRKKNYKRFLIEVIGFKNEIF